MALSVRTTITVDGDLQKQIDDFAKRNGFTRSGFMSLACAEYMKAKEIEPALKVTLENLASSYEALVKKVDQINAKK